MHWWFVVGKLIPWLIAGATVSAFFAMIWLISHRFPIPSNLDGLIRNGLFALILAGAILSALVALVQWFCTTLTLEDGYVVYAKGLLNRSVSKVPVQEIASIDIRQSLFHRMLNAGDLIIDMRGVSLLRMNLLDDPIGIRNAVLDMRSAG